MKTLCYLLLISALFSCSTQAQTVSPDKFEEGLKPDIQLLDVRTPEEFEEGHIANAMLANIQDEKEFSRRVAALDKESPVYVYCLAGGRSSNAATILKKQGFKQVVDLDGGINAWRRAGKPLEGNGAVAAMSQEEYNAMTGKAALVLVDFGAPWCPPCRKMNPVVEQLEKDFAGKMMVMRIDGGKQAELMKLNDITEMPGFVLYKDGKEVWRDSGAMEREKLAAAIQKHL